MEARLVSGQPGADRLGVPAQLVRFDVCRCFAGRLLSSSRILSMMPKKASSFGRTGGWLRRYPGGTENDSIFETVRGSIPKRRAAARQLIPSI